MLKRDISVALVERLVASQFPQWADLPVVPIDLDGWDNTTFRLGEAMSVRLPSADPYVAQVEKEHRWLPVLGPCLPVLIPVPLAKGAPSAEFPRPWSVYRWIDGHTATGDALGDLEALAVELGGFLGALHRCEPDGPPAGDHSFSRGGPVSIWDGQVRELLARLDGVIDLAGAGTVWEAALDAPHRVADVWVHGDLTGSNLLVRDGHLAGVIDFGCCAIGDPACDLTVAWTLFAGTSRSRFRSLVPVEATAWARARGWALWKALVHLHAGLSRPGRGQRRDERAGWRVSAADVVAELIRDIGGGDGDGRSRPDPAPLTAVGPEEDGSPRLVLRDPTTAHDIRLFLVEHLPGVLRLCEAEGWPSLPEDPQRARRVLTAPGVTTVVSLDRDDVIGFAQLLSDGEIQTFLASLVVARSQRGRGLGRALVEEALRAAGGQRVDLLSENAAVGFYESFPHQRKPGFRLHPFYE